MHSAKRPKRGSSWQAIGAGVAHFRRRAGLTQEQLAERANIHVDTVRSIEQGRLALQPDRAEQFDQLLDTGGVLAVMAAKVPVRERVVQFAQGLVEHEQEALSVLSYQSLAVPGLLQTPEYCRAVFDYRYPALGDETAEQWVTARMERQLVWQRERPPVGHFVLEESILRREVGGRETMRGQIRKILEACEPVHMSVQVMPMNRAPHACLDGPMVLLETPDHERLVYLEVQRASFLVEDPGEVSDYHLQYGMLRSQALSPDESVRLLNGLLGES
ncbi:Scr1 family TA system antitoxin-like transcriptional regulator [Streptomyces turgidiscabies]|uniref:Toxin-antitoxin system, antitoxin component, Xre family n=3 Tax=Streptomyces TaxID=1883 RepID=L7FD04_STRT8|nr:helix-turn-helix transcriptional regulator [Streptomyces turgidiscabies]ELP69433.1 toxin-antitoxin system, antitoxin component, Xre family [Streptomyces turgidiscabies Car8]MDX3496816.1 helix-turn-helix transcriptional regulator [Streptomyces turgidiscabies]GAQ74079.1 helix-turn-helix protein [Streptomyces turgidiscabies]